jgi:hypothetical protein
MQALGYRGIGHGWSLTHLFAQERGMQSKSERSPLTIPGILRWIDAYHARTGAWPATDSGVIPESPGDTWRRVQDALDRGNRGLRGGSSLAKLLTEKRGRRNRHAAPDLTVPQIIAWAEAFQAQTGRWPGPKSGPIPEAPGETWASVAGALRAGGRGLPGKSSIHRLLEEERGLSNPLGPGELTIPQIVAWADAFQAHHGRWPNPKSGPIPEAPGETWNDVESALRTGLRGLPGGMSLPRLRERGRVATQSESPPAP